MVTRTVHNEQSIISHVGKCTGGMIVAFQITRILISSDKLYWLRLLLYIYFTILALLVLMQFITSGLLSLCFIFFRRAEVYSRTWDTNEDDAFK